MKYFSKRLVGYISSGLEKMQKFLKYSPEENRQREVNLRAGSFEGATARMACKINTDTPHSELSTFKHQLSRNATTVDHI